MNSTLEIVGLRLNLKYPKVILICTLIIGCYLMTTKGLVFVPAKGDVLILIGILSASFGFTIGKVILRTVFVIGLAIYRTLIGGISVLLFVLLI